MIKRVATWFKGSILRTVLVALLIPAVTSIALISFLFSRQSRNALTEQMESNLQQLVIAKAEEINLRLISSDETVLETLQHGVRDIKVLDEAGYGFLLDDTGLVIAHPLPALENVNLLERASGDHQKRLRHMVDGNIGSGYYRDGQSVALLVYAPLESTNWSLGITVPNEAVTAPADEIRDRVFLITILLIFFTTGFSYLFAHLIHQPLAKLLLGVRQLSAGGRADLISVTSFDELNLLAEAFNDMAGKIWERETRLMAKMDELQIEIDAGKKEKRLESIVETDFFKRLEINAERLRIQMHQG